MLTRSADCFIFSMSHIQRQLGILSRNKLTQMKLDIKKTKQTDLLILKLLMTMLLNNYAKSKPTDDKKIILRSCVPIA